MIRAQQPSKLFIIADGPRPTHPSDTALCAEVRNVIEQVDWPCEVHRNYSEVNLGCKLRPKTGLDWVFQQVDRAIVLEDDCLPHHDFFTFCELLLEKYQDNPMVSVITGNNFQNGLQRGDASYYFSKYNHVWGWATWRRAWVNNDSSIEFWPLFRSTPQWKNICTDRLERRYWEGIFDKVYLREFETAWDYPWTASVWYHGGLTATPNVNLVTNIGFGPDGTHTLAAFDMEGIPVAPLCPITHPKLIKQDREADRYVFDHVFGGLNQRWQSKMRRFPRRVAGAVWWWIKGAIKA